MAKECTLSAGKLPLDSVVRITDHHDMTSAVYRGWKETNQTKKKLSEPNNAYYLSMLFHKLYGVKYS